jgi:hypothetical protein
MLLDCTFCLHRPKQYNFVRVTVLTIVFKNCSFLTAWAQPIFVNCTRSYTWRSTTYGAGDATERRRLQHERKEQWFVCHWLSAAQSFIGSGPVETHLRGLLLHERRTVTTTAKYRRLHVLTLLSKYVDQLFQAFAIWQAEKCFVIGE